MITWSFRSPWDGCEHYSGRHTMKLSKALEAIFNELKAIRADLNQMKAVIVEQDIDVDVELPMIESAMPMIEPTMTKMSKEEKRTEFLLKSGYAWTTSVKGRRYRLNDMEARKALLAVCQTCNAQPGCLCHHSSGRNAGRSTGGYIHLPRTRKKVTQ